MCLNIAGLSPTVDWERGLAMELEADDDNSIAAASPPRGGIGGFLESWERASEHGRVQAGAPPTAAYIARARPLHSHKRNALLRSLGLSRRPSQRKAGCTRNPAPLLSELPSSSTPSLSTFAPTWRSPRHPRPPQCLAGFSPPSLADRLASSPRRSSVDQIRLDQF